MTQAEFDEEMKILKRKTAFWERWAAIAWTIAVALFAVAAVASIANLINK